MSPGWNIMADRPLTDKATGRTKNIDSVAWYEISRDRQRGWLLFTWKEAGLSVYWAFNRPTRTGMGRRTRLMTRCGRGEKGRKLDGRAQWNRYGRTLKKNGAQRLTGNGERKGCGESGRAKDGWYFSRCRTKGAFPYKEMGWRVGKPSKWGGRNRVRAKRNRVYESTETEYRADKNGV